MKKVFLENGLRFFQDVLAWLQDGKEESDVDRRNDYTDFGILTDVGEEFDIIEGDNNNPPTTHSVNIRPGLAYDSNGERIEVISPIIAFDPSAPTSTSSDGKGGTTVTPQSTGSLNVILTGNVNNFIWIDYLATRDISEVSLQKITNKTLYFKQDDGFQISVTTVDVAPNPGVSIKLGSVDLTGGGVVSPSTISLVGRISGGIKLYRTKIKVGKLDRSDATASYDHEDEIFLDSHVKALGDGVVSEKNPHGLIPLNIGIDTEEILETHQKFMHSNGIVGDPLSTTTSLFLEFVPVSPGEDFVRIKPIDTDELAHIDGIIVGNSDIPAEVTLLFSSVTDATNTYYVFLNKNTKQIQRSDINPIGDVTKLPLWSFTWTANIGAPNNGNITNIIDLRIFGTLDNSIIDNEDDYEVNKLLINDGLISAPALAFRNELSSGLYRNISGDIRLTVTGVDRLTTNSSESTLKIDSNNKLSVTSTDIVLKLSGVDRIKANSTEVFMAKDASNKMRITATEATITFGGADRLVVNSSNITTNLGIKGITGSVANPSYSFTSFITSGLYSGSGNLIGLSTDGSSAFEATPTATDLKLNGTDILSATSTLTDLKLNGTSFLTANSDEVLIKTGFRFQTTDTGTNLDPIIQRNADPNTGIYWATDEVKFTTGGTNRLTVYNSGIQLNSGTILMPFGAAATPAIRFSGNGSLSEGTGIYYRQQASGAGSSRLEFSIEGVKQIELASTALIASNLAASFSSLDVPGNGFWNSTHLRIEAGNTTTPSLTFGIDQDTGLFRPSSGGIALTVDTVTKLTVEATGTLVKNAGFKRVPHVITTASTGTTTIPTQDVRDHSLVNVVTTGPNVKIKLPTGFGANDAGQEIIIAGDSASTHAFTAGPTGLERVIQSNDFTKWIWTGSSYARSIGF